MNTLYNKTIPYNKIDNYSSKLPILESDTDNIVEYVKQNTKKKKKFNFWKLLEDDKE